MTSRIPPRALDPAGATAGQVPTVGAGATKVEWADPPTAGSIDTLTDVDTTTTPPADAQGLRWNAGLGLWVPGNPTPATHTHTRSQITDAGSAIAYNVPGSGDAAVGEVVLGSDSRLAPFGAKARLTANQSIANGTVVAVSWHATDWDDGGWWSSGNPTVLTVPTGKGGRYRISGQVVFGANATGRRVIRIEVGTTVLARFDGNAVGVGVTSISLDVPAILAAGDAVNLKVFQDSGAAVDLLFGQPNVAWLSVERI